MVAAHEFFVATFSCYRSFSWSGVLSVFAMLGGCGSSAEKTLSRVTISNPEASQRNLAVISQLLSLEFSNLSMNLLDRESVHLDDSKFPQFTPRDVPNLFYESFLLSQMLEIRHK
ncbi:hypothetical protein Tco_0215642 [Tanacetum coccineum]